MPTNEIEYHKLKILLVEDEMHTRTIIKSLLRQLHISFIDEAANGRDGLLKVTDHKPHLVLCDIHMQPVDGLEFLRILRGLEDTIVRRTPVIFLTADAKKDNVLVAKEHEANGYLVKPVSLSALKARIDQVAATLKL